jgi:CBS domain containing-hemolysin-like protein
MSGFSFAWAVGAALLLLAVDLVLSVVTLSASALSRVALRRMNTESGNRLRFLEEFKTVPSEHRAAVHTLRELALLGAVGLIAWVSAAAGWPGGFWGGLALGALIAVVLVEGVLARWLALQDPRTALRLASGLVRGARFVTWPLLVPVNAVFRRPAHEVDEDDDRDDDDDDEDVEAFIEVGEREGILEKSEGEMVRGIVDLDQTLVREIMTPRVDVVVLPAAATVDEARRIALEAGHSRFPVFGESIDHIVGILHVRDLLRASDPSWKEPGIAGLLRPPLFVPATRTVKEVLAEMRTRAHVALCVDEYGGFAGMVTLEDLLEEIVDEHEHEDTPLRAEAGGSWLVSGLAHADELERLFGVDLGERDYDTVGGFVTSALGRVPGPGERFASRGLAVEIVEADPRRVWRVRVRPTEARS